MEKILAEKYQILQVLFLNFAVNQFLVRIFLNRFAKVFKQLFLTSIAAETRTGNVFDLLD